MTLADYAVRYATAGLPANRARGPVPVLLLRGKAPAVPGGHGVLDATTDVDLIREQCRRHRPSGIGIPVQPWEVRLDVDPRHGGHATLARLVAKHGALPATLTAVTGRGDDGQHISFLRPPGRLTGRRLPGIDVLGAGKYTVVEPSIHPDTGGVYRWVRPCASIGAMPAWLAALVVEPDLVVGSAPRCGGIPAGRFSGPSTVEGINSSLTWADVLEPHGWRLVRGDGDADGSGWRHRAATSPCSATVRGGRLYVWSPNTVFDVTEPGIPRGYSKAEALAVLDHDGDLRALVDAVRRTGAIR